jgi:hypothetical protein
MQALQPLNPLGSPRHHWRCWAVSASVFSVKGHGPVHRYAGLTDCLLVAPSSPDLSHNDTPSKRHSVHSTSTLDTPQLTTRGLGLMDGSASDSFSSIETPTMTTRSPQSDGHEYVLSHGPDTIYSYGRLGAQNQHTPFNNTYLGMRTPGEQ